MSPEYSSTNDIPLGVKSELKLFVCKEKLNWHSIIDSGFFFFKNGNGITKFMLEKDAGDGQKKNARKQNGEWHWVHGLKNRSVNEVQDRPYAHLEGKILKGRNGR